MGKQTPQVGDRVVLDITEPCLAHLPEAARVGRGRIRKIWIRHMDAGDLENISYTIRLDGFLLSNPSNREWEVRAKPGEWPAQLKMEGGNTRHG